MRILSDQDEQRLFEEKQGKRKIELEHIEALIEIDAEAEMSTTTEEEVEDEERE